MLWALIFTFCKQVPVVLKVRLFDVYIVKSIVYALG